MSRLARGTGLVPEALSVAPWGSYGQQAGDGPDSCTALFPFARPGADQGRTNSCVWFSLAQALHVLSMRRDGVPLRLSELAGYWLTRKRTSVGGEVDDYGCRPSDAAHVLSEVGWVPASRWPFDARKVNAEPDMGALQAAPSRRWFEMHRITSWGEQRCRDIRVALSGPSPTPVLIGLAVDMQFQEWHGGAPWSLVGDVEGLHMEVALGYERAGLWVLGSWGDDQGVDGGWTLVSWDAVMGPETSDAWVARLL